MIIIIIIIIIDNLTPSVLRKAWVNKLTNLYSPQSYLPYLPYLQLKIMISFRFLLSLSLSHVFFHLFFLTRTLKEPHTHATYIIIRILFRRIRILFRRLLCRRHAAYPSRLLCRTYHTYPNNFCCYFYVILPTTRRRKVDVRGRSRCRSRLRQLSRILNRMPEPFPIPNYSNCLLFSVRISSRKGEGGWQQCYASC